MCSRRPALCMWARTAFAIVRQPTLPISGIPVKVGMALTAHKTVSMFMRYVHTENDPVRQATDLVGYRHKTIAGTLRAAEVVG